jgi:hypothetical protein
LRKTWACEAVALNRHVWENPDWVTLFRVYIVLISNALADGMIIASIERGEGTV